MQKHSRRSWAANILERIGHWLALCSGSVAVVFFAAMVTAVLLGIFFRYIVRDPLQWTEELARFLMLWTGFLAMNVAMHHQMHLKIDSLINVLPAWLRNILGYICDILIGLFLFVLTVKGYAMTKNTMMLASSMKLSMFWIYMAVPLGAFLTLIQLVLQVGRKILKPE